MKRFIIIFVVLLVASSVTFVACWVSYVVGSANGSVMIKEYERGVHDTVGFVDQLATEGRTNDIHEVCQKLGSVFILKGSDFTNLDMVVEDARSRVEQQPSTLAKP